MHLWRLSLTLASLATLSSASSGCWSEVISGRSPGANIVSKGYTHSSSASSAACQAYCETFSNCLAIIYAPGQQCTPIARVYESNYMSSSYQFVSNFVEGATCSPPPPARTRRDGRGSVGSGGRK